MLPSREEYFIVYLSYVGICYIIYYLVLNQVTTTNGKLIKSFKVTVGL